MSFFRIVSFLAILAVTALGQGGPSLVAVAGGYSLQNPLGAPFTALIVARDASGRAIFQTSAYVPANGSVAIKVPKSLLSSPQLEQQEAIHVSVPRFRINSGCGESLGTGSPSMGALREELKSMAVSDSPEGKAKIAAAAAIAELDFEQKMDIKQTERNDPLRTYLDMKADAALTDPRLRAQQASARNQEQLGELVSDIFDKSEEWSAGENEKRDELSGEASKLKKTLDRLQGIAKGLEATKSGYEQTAAIGAVFMRQTAEAFVRAPLPAFPGGLTVSENVHRVCKEPNGATGIVMLRAAVPEQIDVLLAEAHFDKGGTEPTIFRRMAGTDQWAARLYWPSSAAKASFQVRLPGQKSGQPAGQVDAGRVSFNQALLNAHKTVALVQKKYKEANFRSAGADVAKTVIIP